MSYESIDHSVLSSSRFPAFFPLAAFHGCVSPGRVSWWGWTLRVKDTPHNQLQQSPLHAQGLGLGLNALLQQTNPRSLVTQDPVELVHTYRDPHDQEVAGLIVAGLAYGRVRAIKDKARAALSLLGPSPSEAIRFSRRRAQLEGFCYRFQRGQDLPRFLKAISNIRRKYGSLGAAFVAQKKSIDRDHADTAAHFVGRIRAELEAPLSYGLRYLLPDPGTGGAAKRLLLYLRWMIRGPDGMDLGAWRTLAPDLEPSGLVIPLDTHIARIARYLGLTQRAANDLRTAREITAALAQIDVNDPVRFDMAICHLGISGACPPERDETRCRVCPVRNTCLRVRVTSFED